MKLFILEERIWPLAHLNGNNVRVPYERSCTDAIIFTVFYVLFLLCAKDAVNGRGNAYIWRFLWRKVIFKIPLRITPVNELQQARSFYGGVQIFVHDWVDPRPSGKHKRAFLLQTVGCHRFEYWQQPLSTLFTHLVCQRFRSHRLVLLQMK